MVDFNILRPLPDFGGNVLNAYDAGRSRVGQQQASRALMGGDQQGAVNALYGSGQIDQGLELANQQRQQQRQDAVYDRQKTEWGRDDEAYTQGKRKETMGRALNIAKSLRAMPVDQRGALYQSQAIPVLRELQVPDEEIQRVLADGRLGDDELDGFIVEMGGVLQAPAQVEQYTLAPGSRRFDANGRLVAESPHAPEYRAVGEGQSLVELGGGGGGGPMAAPELDFDGIDAMVQQNFGVGVNSSTRTPQRNAAVQGQPDSYHLTGQARDYPIPPGMTAQQFAAQLQARVGPQYEVIPEPERNHVHIEPAPGVVRGRGDGSRVVAQGAPKRGYRMLTPQEKVAQGLDEKVQFQISPQGQITRLSEGAADKPATEGQINSASLTFAALGGNDRLNTLAEQGMYKPRTPSDRLFTKDGILRWATMTPEDRQFVQAAKEFVAPILRKDTGAAVTDQELMTYMDIMIPKFEDGPEVLWQKAQARDTSLRRLYGSGRKAFDQEYGAPEKWRVLTDPRGQPKPKASAAPARGGGRGGAPAPARPALGDIFK